MSGGMNWGGEIQRHQDYFRAHQEVKNLPASEGEAGDASSVHGLGRSPGEGNGNLLQYHCLENSMDRDPGGL